MLRLLLSLLISISIFSCSSIQLIRTEKPAHITGPPIIKTVIDLGGLPLAALGIIDQKMNDNLYTPGEWAAIVGNNLASPETKVMIDKKMIDVSGYFEDGSILVRIPRGISPLAETEIIVKTELGESAFPVKITSYVVIGDTKAKMFRFYRTNTDNGEYLENEVSSISSGISSRYTISPNGSMLYITQSESLTSNTHMLTAVHLGNSDCPVVSSSIELGINSLPSAVDVNPSGDILLVLGNDEILLFDISNPVVPEVIGKLSLPSNNDNAVSSYINAEFFDDGKSALVLEAFSNTIQIINLSIPSKPKITQSLELAPGIKFPVIPDIKQDPGDPSLLWVLQGPNMNLSYQGFAELLINLVASNKSDNKDDESLVGQKQLLKLRHRNNRLTIEKKIPLPRGFFPLSMHADKKMNVLVSGVNYDLLGYTEIEPDFEGMKKILTLLENTIALGRIIRIKDNDEIITEAKGLSVFFDVESIPGDVNLIYSVMKLGPRYIPPSLGVDPGIEIREKQHIIIRKLDWKTILPPYDMADITVQ